jgi:imidazolonepropionase-like amidohydrolase
VQGRGISYSIHSDAVIAPAQLLLLMHCAVNRTTMSRRVVTLDAAYSLRMENEIGSIASSNLANFASRYLAKAR